jgi:FkbM family methyltransferase
VSDIADPLDAARAEHLGFLLRAMALKRKGLAVLLLQDPPGMAGWWEAQGARVTVSAPSDLRRSPEASGRGHHIVHAVEPFHGDDPPADTLRTLASMARRAVILEVDFAAALPAGARDRSRLFERAGAVLPHLYCPSVQPDHPAFPRSWSADRLGRTVWVATRKPLANPLFFTTLLDRAVSRAGGASGDAASLARALRSLRIANVLDVGANLGQFATRTRADGFDGPIVSFEPLTAALPALRRAAAADGSWQVHGVALGAEDGERTINIAANSWSSSLLEALPETLAAEPMIGAVAQETIMVRRLDTIWPEIAPRLAPGPTLLKIDTQGFEGAVLDGAAATLTQVDAVLMECALVPSYAGAPPMEAMIARLRSAGFSPVWLQPGWGDGATGQVFECDMLFARTARLAA